jgi:hypothetical protein
VRILELTDPINDSYIVGFRGAHTEQPRVLSNKVFASWGLAIPPEASRWDKDDYDDSETSG